MLIAGGGLLLTALDDGSTADEEDDEISDSDGSWITTMLYAYTGLALTGIGLPTAIGGAALWATDCR